MQLRSCSDPRSPNAQELCVSQPRRGRPKGRRDGSKAVRDSMDLLASLSRSEKRHLQAARFTQQRRLHPSSRPSLHTMQDRMPCAAPAVPASGTFALWCPPQPPVKLTPRRYPSASIIAAAGRRGSAVDAAVHALFEPAVAVTAGDELTGTGTTLDATDAAAAAATALDPFHFDWPHW